MSYYKDTLVSVIIPVYNVEDCISKCLKSVIEQTYKKLEIIVIDDGSIDNSLEIIKTFSEKDHRINIIHEENMGVAHARNVGIKSAKGDYISFVDADDWIDPNMIEKMLESIEEADILSADYFQNNENCKEEIIQIPFGKNEYKGDDMYYFFSKMICDDEGQTIGVMLWNKLYKKKIFDRVNLKIADGIAWGEDAILLYSYLIKCQSVKIVHQSYYHYQYRSNSAVHRKNLYILDNIGDYYRRLYTLFENTDPKYKFINQLQKYVVSLLGIAALEKMDFSVENYLPVYIIDFNFLKNKKIVLYGAGQVGKSYYTILKKENFEVEIVLWVDKNYSKFINTSFNVQSIDKINDFEFDYILIAVSFNTMAENIRNELIYMNIPKNKIVWVKPKLIT